MPTHPQSKDDHWQAYGIELSSRLLIGTALYPSPALMQDAIRASKAEIVTLSLRRQSPEQRGGETFWELVQELGCHLLPNTAGCHSVQEAVALAEMSRELFQTDWIKLEVIGDDYNLQPDPIGLLEATEILLSKGFKVFPYCTDDLVLCQHLRDLGCEVLMPWGAPIGTGKGLINPYALTTLRERLADVTLIIDAGIGKPSDAVQAMELGYDAVLLNTAVAQALQPVMMASAFRAALESGRLAWRGGMIAQRGTAEPSTSPVGMPFWHHHGPLPD